MGDRGNIVIKEPGGGQLCLYAHWLGAELPKILQDAMLKGKERWGDEPYLARIIFCEMIKYDENALENTTGFGISTYITDNEHDLLILNCQKQIVSRVEETTNGSKGEWSFEEFIKLDVGKEFEEF